MSRMGATATLASPRLPSFLLQHDAYGALARLACDWEVDVEHDPEAAAPFRRRGASRFAQGDFGGAVEDLYRAVLFDPGDVEARLELAAAQGARGDLAAARREYGRLLALIPSEGRARIGEELTAGSGARGARETLVQTLERLPRWRDQVPRVRAAFAARATSAGHASRRSRLVPDPHEDYLFAVSARIQALEPLGHAAAPAAARTSFRAFALDTGQALAVHVPWEAPTPGGNELLRRAQATYDHPGFIRLHETGRVEGGRWAGQVFLATDLALGPTLEVEHCRRPLAPAESAGLFAELCAALSHAHELRAAAHGSVLPGNIVVDRELGRARLRLPWERVGLPLPGESRDWLLPAFRIAAPEQLSDHAPSPAADVWALGVLLYWLSTGQWPHDGRSAREVLQSIAFDTPLMPRVLAPELPIALEAAILSALARNPAERPSAAELGRALRAVA